MLFSFLPLIFYFLKKAFKTLTLNTFTFFSKSIVYFLKLYFRYRASTSRDFKDIAKWSVNFKLPSLFIKIGVTLFVTLNFLNFIYSYFKILKSTVNRIAQHSFVFYLNYPVFRLLSADPTEWLFIFLKNNFIHLFTVFGSFFFKKLSVLYLKFLFYIGGFLSYFLTFLNYTISTFENILTFFFLVISVISDKIPTLVSILTIYFDLIFLSKVRVLFVILKSIIRWTYFRFALPLRIVFRVFSSVQCLILATLWLSFYDFFSLVMAVHKLFKFKTLLLYLRRSFFFVTIAYYFSHLGDLIFFENIQLFLNLDFFFYKKSLFSFILSYTNLFSINPVMVSIIFIFILLEVASLYFSVSVSKRLLFSIYFLILFFIFLLYWFLPDFYLFNIFLLKMNGFVLLILFTFRSLREDQRFFNGIGVDPFKFMGDNSSFRVRRGVSIVFRIFDSVFNPYAEHVYFISLIFYLCFLVGNFNFCEFYDKFFIFYSINYSSLVKFVIFIFLFFRQSTYSYLVWFFCFFYLMVWSFTSIFLLISSGFSYFGTIFNTNFSETSAINSLGLVSSVIGLESLIFPGNLNLFPFYFGESLFFELYSLSNLEFFDRIQFVNSPFNPFGDMNIPPYMSTPHDDHNWAISNSLEKSYFNSFRLERSASEFTGSDYNSFWMIEPNFYKFFGEYVDPDLYYGWSHSVLIDTQTYFDYSPYSLTNIFGDSLLKNIVTDIFTVFVGPSELDESSLLNLRDWGSSYHPGSTTNRISGGEMSGLEDNLSLNMEQKVRENGEGFHEWFPGLFVLDGRFDSKFFLFFLRIFLIAVVPIASISWAFAVLGKPSNNFDENFGETEFTNFNFYFFGNEQVETFSTYFWNPTINVNFEWPTDDYSNDPIAYEPTNNMFEDIFKNVQSGLFNFSVLDSFYFLPILKHTEGFSSESYKDFVMPLIFPTGSDSKSARVVDFSNFYNNIKKITESNIASNGYVSSSEPQDLHKKKHGNHFKFYKAESLKKDRAFELYTKSKKYNHFKKRSDSILFYNISKNFSNQNTTPRFESQPTNYDYSDVDLLDYEYRNKILSVSKYFKKESNHFRSPNLTYDYVPSRRFPKLVEFNFKKTIKSTPLVSYGYFDIKNYSSMYNSFQEPKYFKFFEKKNKYFDTKKPNKYGSSFSTNKDSDSLVMDFKKIKTGGVFSISKPQPSKYLKNFSKEKLYINLYRFFKKIKIFSKFKISAITNILIKKKTKNIVNFIDVFIVVDSKLIIFKTDLTIFRYWSKLPITGLKKLSSVLVSFFFLICFSLIAYFFLINEALILTTKHSVLLYGHKKNKLIYTAHPRILKKRYCGV